MKTIGLLGGMSWQSTQTYYRLINEAVSRRLGGLHSAKIVLYSVDFDTIQGLQKTGRWDEAAKILGQAAQKIEKAEADFVVLCTNTMHRVATQIQNYLRIPLLHIADATAKRIKKDSLSTIGLLGTQFTMEDSFYCSRLIEQHGLNVLIPEEPQRREIHRIIYDELCAGKINQDSRNIYDRTIHRLKDRGAEGIILGCTEISLLVSPEFYSFPLYDTTEIHALAAVDLALADDDCH